MEVAVGGGGGSIKWTARKFMGSWSALKVAEDQSTAHTGSNICVF